MNIFRKKIKEDTNKDIWISMKDKQPEPYKWVFIFVNKINTGEDHIRHAGYYPMYGWWECGDDSKIPIKSVSYWIEWIDLVPKGVKKEHERILKEIHEFQLKYH